MKEKTRSRRDADFFVPTPPAPSNPLKNARLRHTFGRFHFSRTRKWSRSERFAFASRRGAALARFWISFFLARAAVNDFRRRFFSGASLPKVGGGGGNLSLLLSGCRRRERRNAPSLGKKATAGFVRRRLRIFFVFIERRRRRRRKSRIKDDRRDGEREREKKGTFIQSHRRSRSLSRERGIRIKKKEDDE